MIIVSPDEIEISGKYETLPIEDESVKQVTFFRDKSDKSFALADMMPEMVRVLKPNGIIVVIESDGECKTIYFTKPNTES